MATRAIIKVEGINYVQVYKHWEGYPEHMLPWLESFNQAFTKSRGVDSEYKIAQLLRDSALRQDELNLDPNTCTGYGLVPIGNKYCADYVYTLWNDGHVTIEQERGF